jgi:hypothetical protein
MKRTGLTSSHRHRLSKVAEEGCPCRKMLKDEFDIDMDEYEDQMEGGKGEKAKPSDFDIDQIKMGVEVEMEHTDDPYTALEITMDHLTEFEDYYTQLDEMESEAKKKAKAWRRSAQEFDLSPFEVELLRDLASDLAPLLRKMMDPEEIVAANRLRSLGLVDKGISDDRQQSVQYTLTPEGEDFLRGY